MWLCEIIECIITVSDKAHRNYCIYKGTTGTETQKDQQHVRLGSSESFIERQNITKKCMYLLIEI